MRRVSTESARARESGEGLAVSRNIQPTSLILGVVVLFVILIKYSVDRGTAAQ
jgi:hypothetical protein